MKTILRLFSYGSPIATLWIVLNYRAHLEANAMEVVTVILAFFFVGFSLQSFLRSRLNIPLNIRCLASTILFLITAFCLRLFNWNETLIGSLLLVQGFLFTAETVEPNLIFIANALPVLLSLVSIRCTALLPQKSAKEMTVSEGYNLDHSFKFTEESHPGNLPTHRLYRNEVEKFNGESEQGYNLCLVSLPLQFDRIIRGGPRRVVIFGGADGIAARSALTFSSVKALSIIDPDENLYRAAVTEPKFRVYNLDSLLNKKTTASFRDPLAFVMGLDDEKFDLAILDLPPPRTRIDTRVFSFEFVSLLSKRISENGMIVLPAPREFHGQIQRLANRLDLSFVAVVAKSFTTPVFLLVKGPEPLEKPLAGLLKGPLKAACRQADIERAKDDSPFTLSSLLESRP